MAEYINKQELLQDIHESVVFSVARSGKGQTSLEIKGANKVLDRINSAPAADVVEVVRCSECQFWNTFKKGFGDERACKLHSINNVYTTYKLPNSFCSDGERRCEE